MTGYLQRLLDSQTAPMPVRPSQLSRSPLLAADQRLASPEFASNFQFIPPGEDVAADIPPASIDFTQSPSSSQDTQAAQKTDQPSAKTSGRQMLSGKMVQEDRSTQKTPSKSRKAVPDDPQPARILRSEPRTETTSEAKVPLDRKPLVDAVRSLTRDDRQSAQSGHDKAKPDSPRKSPEDPANPAKAVQNKSSHNIQPTAKVSPLPERQSAQERIERDAGLKQVQQPAKAEPAAPDLTAKAQPAIQNQIVAAHPVRQSLPEIPPAAVPGPDMAEIEGLVTRMLGARLDQNGGDDRTARAPGSAETKPASPPRPMTAKDASVIGPIEFAPRQTMLFGRRYR